MVDIDRIDPTPSGLWNMRAGSLIVREPTTGSDAATKTYVDAQVVTAAGSSFNTSGPNTSFAGVTAGTTGSFTGSIYGLDILGQDISGTNVYASQLGGSTPVQFTESGLWLNSGTYAPSGAYQTSGLYAPSGAYQVSGLYQASGTYQSSGAYVISGPIWTGSVYGVISGTGNSFLNGQFIGSSQGVISGTGPSYTGDHLSSGTLQMVNVLYGSGAAPPASGTTIGALYLTYS